MEKREGLGTPAFKKSYEEKKPAIEIRKEVPKRSGKEPERLVSCFFLCSVVGISVCVGMSLSTT